MFSKIEVNGEGRHPLYQKLIAAAPTAVAPEEADSMPVWSAKVVHRCTLMIFYGILRNF
ncbi:hypothetical protein ACVXG8_23610 [Escherichia coli]